MPHRDRGAAMLATVALVLLLTGCLGSKDAPSLPALTADSLAELQGTEWLLTSLYGHEPAEGVSVILGFYPDNYLEGEAGCNSYGASYSISGTAINLPEIHKTSFDCDVPDSVTQQEQAYLQALESVAAYRATSERLELGDDAGEAILVFARKLPPKPDPLLADTKWTLEFLDGERPLEVSRITLNLGQEGFEGFSGCNRYGGDYEQADQGILRTGSVWQTAMECESPILTEQEQFYVEALRNAASYRVEDERLEINDALGETSLTFIQETMFSMNPDHLLDTAWQLVSLDGDSLVEGSIITLFFHKDYWASGHAGCRAYTAAYDASDSDLNFLYMAMFETGCSEEEVLEQQESDYTTILGWSSGYRLQNGRLELLTERGEVLEFAPLRATTTASLEGTEWVLSAFIEETHVQGMAVPLPGLAQPLPETQITASFENGIVDGSAGCNSYGAPYAVDGFALQVETPESTAMECQDPPDIMEQERRYLGALAGAGSYRIHYNQLWLDAGDGRTLVFAVSARAYGLADLVGELRAAGLAVESAAESVDHGFAIRGQRVLVDGTPIFGYEFADAAAADAALERVSVDEYSMTVTRPEGEAQVETHSDWIETPHLHKRGRLIVVAGDATDVLGALDAAMGAAMRPSEPRDCSIPNAFPPEEAQLIWPTLQQVRPAQAAPGDRVEIRGTGGHLYWNNECGEFRNESAKDFQLSFDGEALDSITCYAHTCLVTLTIPADATPGNHTISVEGGSSIGIQIGDEPVRP